MRYDIMMMWSDDKPPGSEIFNDLRKAGAVDILRNGTIKSGNRVFFTTYATLSHSSTAARAFSEALSGKYDLEAVEMTWSPPDVMWSVYGWCQRHRFQGVADAIEILIDAVSNRYLR